MICCRRSISGSGFRRGRELSTGAENEFGCYTDEAAAFVTLLRVCAKNKDLHSGTRAHDDIAKRGLIPKCSDALVAMYAKCGAPVKAKDLLDIHKSSNVATWTALMVGYVQLGQDRDALICFECMQCQGLHPDAVTYACILKACANTEAVETGEQIHDDIVRQGLLRNDIVLGTALVDMYCKCGALAKARQVLDELPARDIVSWNALIAGYAQHGHGEQVLSCFQEMRREGLSADSVTFACILKAYAMMGAADEGKQIHDEIIRQGLLGNDIVLGNALVDMYAKCGALVKARQVLLDELPSRDSVAWSTLIAAYAQQNLGDEALECFELMKREGLSPSSITFACILKACGSIGAVDKGLQIHDEVIRNGLLGCSLVLGNALVDMYARCGALAKAQRVLEELPVRDVVTWSTLIAGYAQQGRPKQALSSFDNMQHGSIPPDAVTFSSVLSACSQLGLVEDAYKHFMSMVTECHIKPELEHYTCLIDLFGRTGQLYRAVEIIQEMPCFNDPAVYYALLGSCHKWGDVGVGKWAFKQAVQVDKNDAAAYILMSKIYVAAGRPEDAETVETMRLENAAGIARG